MDRRKNLRAFLASFLLSLLLIFGYCGFALVDMSTQNYDFTSFEPALSVYASGDEEVSVKVFGYRMDFSTWPLQNLSTFLKDYSSLVPAKIRLFFQGVTLSSEALRETGLLP